MKTHPHVSGSFALLNPHTVGPCRGLHCTMNTHVWVSRSWLTNMHSRTSLAAAIHETIGPLSTSRQLHMLHTAGIRTDDDRRTTLDSSRKFQKVSVLCGRDSALNRCQTTQLSWLSSFCITIRFGGAPPPRSCSCMCQSPAYLPPGSRSSHGQYGEKNIEPFLRANTLNYAVARSVRAQRIAGGTALLAGSILVEVCVLVA
ncbi:hypothetical protein F5883DRAFT_17274 [Diaporthe sp. PMI_573]|nr:hypothetical protein F5883DRAFT_17274 [Diaporthaceae sp. PMI_573]